MIRSEPDITRKLDERVADIYTASMRGAWIAAVFVIIVLGLLAGNYSALKSADPQKSTQLKSLKLRLEKHPRDEGLKKSIRKLDANLRREFFSRTEFARQGGYVLLVGVGLFLIAGASAAGYRKKLPLPGILDERADELRKGAATGRRSAVAFGVIAACGFIALAVLSRGDLTGEFLAASKNYVKESSAEENLPSVAQASTTTALPAASAPAAAGVPVPGAVVLSGIKPLPPLALGTLSKIPSANGNKPGAKPEAPKIKTVAFDANDYSPSTDEWAKNWPVFRGPYGNGFIESGNYPVKWDGGSGENVLWKTEIPLPGWNSPVVWGDRVFVSAADEKSREVYCLDASSGKILWKTPIEMIAKQADVFEDTGYAPSTMAVDGKRIFVIFPNGDLACLDFEGKRIWTRGLGLPENMYGHASSLAMFRSLLIVQFDQGSDDDGKSAVLALQGGTGEVVWYGKRPVGNSWTTPIVINTGQRLELITSANPWVVSYDPMNGSEYWRADLMSGDVAPSPIYSGGFVLACNTGAVMAAIKPGGQGDVTKSHVAWKSSDGLPDMTSPAANGELVFLITSEGTLTCLDCKTGDLVWEHSFDKSFKASPVIVGKHVYLQDEDGVMHIISVGREFKEEYKSVLSEKIGSTPAFVGGRIFIRGEKHLYCIGAK